MEKKKILTKNNLLELFVYSKFFIFLHFLMLISFQ